MARGLILSGQTRTCSTLLSTCVATLSLSPTKCKHLKIPLISPLCRLSTRFSCNCSHAHSVELSVDMIKYKEAFSRRMAMAGLKPHHRIALGVSGGPDSMALCVLTAGWKKGGQNAVGDSGGEFIDGLLAIIVDHGLREDSQEEATMVSSRVSDMGIRCELVRCNWLDGRPKRGHLQEAARDMRYRLFQNVCMQNQISALLVAHHADDQAELFILRLSRNSGVLGLAGMASTSQIFSTHNRVSKNHSILLVRPLLEFSKGDMYKICQGGNQDWVEDPTNRSPLFARNRIRMSLGNLSCLFDSELQAVISTCRKTRSYVECICYNLINQTVTMMDHGYAVIDLEILNPSKVDDICLSKFLASVLQFISQRQRPIRGSTSKLLLDYIRTFPCKTSLTAAGCFLCPAPRSRGAKALVCCSVDCPLPSKMELINTYSNGEHTHCDSNLEQIIADAKCYSDNLVPDVSEVQFLDVTSDSVLTEAKRFSILSESTYRNILLLQKEERKHFKVEAEFTSDHELTDEVQDVSGSPSEPLQPGQLCYFMNRFFVTWKLSNDITRTSFPDEVCGERGLGGKSWNRHSSCIVGDDMVAEVRHMIESDWLYLAKLTKDLNLEDVQQAKVTSRYQTQQIMEKTDLCLNYARASAQRALQSLKSIPVAARRSLPVLVNNHGRLLSIPSINFSHCPCLMASAVFDPKVPLGGGHSSFL